MKKRKIIVAGLLSLSLSIFFVSPVNSQVIQEEDDCDIEVFTGVRTYPPGSSDRFDWECQGDGLSCTEVYITCPRT